MPRAELALVPLLAACSAYAPDAALSPLWPAFSACMAREQARLAPGSAPGNAAAARCNAEAVLLSPPSTHPEK
ncbi:MAG: hypothetical protein JOZ90_10855 [Alphaproteobacteria bacterium]|nr:hypothetical protein [Alphaproteobacteria bacterium]MBV9371042.1 hypothetical protein [Alphaproteobacteria bacterium]MBV9901584.1 hypothetical protein [Alphaproteobacteria bacterium]